MIATSDKNNDTDYTSFKLFIGDKEIPVQHVLRLRDWGTTYIVTDQGILFAPVNRDKKPTWNDEEIIE